MAIDPIACQPFEVRTVRIIKLDVCTYSKIHKTQVHTTLEFCLRWLLKCYTPHHRKEPVINNLPTWTVTFSVTHLFYFIGSDPQKSSDSSSRSVHLNIFSSILSKMDSNTPYKHVKIYCVLPSYYPVHLRSIYCIGCQTLHYVGEGGARRST